jgi:acetamidase/formamidase
VRRRVVIHDLELRRETLHGHFSCELQPILEVSSGERVRFSAPDAGWGLAPHRLDGTPREPMFERDRLLDAGHALVGPIAVRGAQAGGTLAVTIEQLRVGSYGWTSAGGWRTPLNDRLGVSDGQETLLVWAIDEGRSSARDQFGHEVTLRPFLGVIGMPPPSPGVHPTFEPRRWGGNIDCSELVVGSTLFLPIPVDGALLSAGDCHARQGDGEASSTAIECPVEQAQLRLELDERELSTPIARTANAWLSFGFDPDLDEAAAAAVDGMLDLMGREYTLPRREALALASVIVDLRVTQLVNGARGVHAVLPRHVLETD